MENISLSDKKKYVNKFELRGVSWNIDCQWQISLSRLCEFGEPDSNAIIFKTNNFFYFLFSFRQSTINFKHFQKKDDCHSYFISEITDCERVG